MAAYPRNVKRAHGTIKSKNLTQVSQPKSWGNKCWSILLTAQAPSGVKKKSYARQQHLLFHVALCEQVHQSSLSAACIKDVKYSPTHKWRNWISPLWNGVCFTSRALSTRHHFLLKTTKRSRSLEKTVKTANSPHHSPNEKYCKGDTSQLDSPISCEIAEGSHHSWSPFSHSF